MDYNKGKGEDIDKDKDIDAEDDFKVKEIESRSIPVIEESVDIQKERIETGKVSIRKIVHDEEQDVDIPLIQEHVEVENIIINKYVDSPPKVRQEGDTTIIPILKEVIEKRLVLVEEVRVTKRNIQTHTKERVNLRKEEIVVERERIDPKIGKE